MPTRTAGMQSRVAVVHNGIIENFSQLRTDMEAEGVVFTSETDTEVVAHLVEGYMLKGENLLTAVRHALPCYSRCECFCFFERR